MLCYLMPCYYTGHFQMIFGVYFNTDTKRARTILDNIIITSQSNVVKTSELQFVYKSNCSTIMCCTLVIETTQ